MGLSIFDHIKAYSSVKSQQHKKDADWWRKYWNQQNKKHEKKTTKVTT